MIRSKEGGWEQYKECKQGYHEYEWMPAICDYVCFFCLDVEAHVEEAEEEEFNSHDEFLIWPLNSGNAMAKDAQEDEGSTDDSENDVRDYDGGLDDDADGDESETGQEDEDGDEGEESGEEEDASGRELGTDADEGK